MESKRPASLWIVAHCAKCQTALEFAPPPLSGLRPDPWKVRCFQCQVLLNYQVLGPSNSTSVASQTPLYSRIYFNLQGQSTDPVWQRLSCTLVEAKDAMIRAPVKGVELYDVLDVDPQATQDQIKRAYHKLAMRFHPDKFQGKDSQERLQAEETFKKVSEAYQILSDPVLRDRYNRYGSNKEQELQPEGGFVHPEDFFKQAFGGDQFVDYIGEISIARDFGDALNGMNSSSTSAAGESQLLTAEERERIRTERIQKLAQNLMQKLKFYVDNPAIIQADASQAIVAQSTGSWVSAFRTTTPEDPEYRAAVSAFEARLREEVEELKSASFGVELLHSIGYTYSLKARQFLGKEESFMGIGKFWNDVREKSHILSETVGTIRAAVELQAALAKLQADDETRQQAADPDTPVSQPSTSASAKKVKPALTAEQRGLLEQQAAAKGLNTIWKGSKLEVESVVRDVCDLVLSGKALEVNGPVADKGELKRRAEALKLMGRVFESVQADPESAHGPYTHMFTSTK